MTQKVLVFIVSIFVISNAIGQKKSMDVRNLNTDKFPQVSGKLWVRNPEKMDANLIRFYENEKPVMVNFSDPAHSDSLSSKKTILFLVLKSKNSRELDWYQLVLKSALEKGIVKKGDQIAIATFSVKDGDHFIYPRKFSYTDNISILKNRIDSLDFHPSNKLYKGKNQIYLAVNEALKMLETDRHTMPTGIIILSDDRNMTPNFQGEHPVERSKKLDIPIYSIVYHNNQFSYETPDLCKQTFGFHYTDPLNDTKDAAASLKGFLNGFIDRHSGLFYPFNYQSTLEKDGLSHTVKVDSQSDQTAFVLNSPKKTLSEWIDDNLILFIVLVIIFIVLIIILIYLIKKRNKKRKEQNELQQEHLLELEKIQEESDRKISEQEQAIREITEREREEKARQEEQVRLAQQEAEDQVQFQKMLERGNLPWFEYKVGTSHGQYQIASPRLTVGRDQSSDWFVPDSTVSRRHFELSFKDYVYTIKDLNSSNGLMVNGHKVTSCELRHGDLIQAGELILTFHI